MTNGRSVMLAKSVSKAPVRHVVVSSMLLALALGALEPAFAGSLGGVSIHRSEGPCSFALQLQNSALEKRRYIARLGEATGDRFAGNSAVEQMYDNIEPASYDPDQDGASDDIWGFSFKKGPVETVGFDAFSRECITCHDGGNAPLVDPSNRNNPFARGKHGFASTDHPIGMEYERYVAANNRKYKPVFGGGKMVFINGKVGCLTCHDPLNPERGHLVMSDRNSALCSSCHNK